MKLLAGVVILLPILAVSALEAVTSSVNLHRKLETSVICPQQNYCSDNTNLVYTKAIGENDTLHYLYSTKGIPTVLVVQTERLGKLLVNWDDFESEQPNGTLAFTGTVFDSYAILITKLLEYNDVNDTADMSDPGLKKDTPDLWKIHDLTSFEGKWVDVNITSNITANEVVFTIDNTTMPDLFNHGGGSLQLKFKAYDIDGRNSLVPHLAYTANTTQIDIALANLSSSFNNSRFALEMYMVSNITGLQANGSANLERSRSIDDEHSPGVFEIIDWTSGGTGQAKGGYVQWKPVCYTSSARTFANLNRAKHYELHDMKIREDAAPQKTIAFAFLGYNLYSEHFSVSATNVSFGLSKDKFYKNTNYVVWSASFGLGIPPADSISPMIILIISLGLGLPAVLIIFGGIGVSIKRWKGDATPYRTIN